jgi:Spy/CpxP family protein refolding chaperone
MNTTNASLRRWLAMAWLGSFALGTPVLASHDRAPNTAGGTAAHRRERFARAVQRLDLSIEQRAQVRSILERHRSTARSEREALRAVRRAQFEAVHSAAFDEERIRAAAADTARAQVDLVVTRARIASEMRALLTAEQRQELDEMLAEARARAERMRGRAAERRGHLE